MDWNKMSEDEKATVAKLLDAQPTVAAKKRMAASIGLEYKMPTVREQVRNKGYITHEHKRGRAIHGRTMAVIPSVILSDERETPEVAVEPQCLREVALELLRLADSMGW